MKLTLMLIVTILCHFLSLNAQNPDPKEILIKSSAILKERRSFSYNVDYRIKRFDYADTLVNPKYKCEVIKAPHDTILRYYARIYNLNEERIYDGVNFTMIWHTLKQVMKNTPALNGKSFVFNNIKRECVPGFLYTGKPFYYEINEGKDWKLSSIQFENEEAWKIEFTLPTNEDITFFKKIILIDKRTFLPEKIESFAKFKDIQDEYYELTLSNFSIKDTLQKSSFDSDNYPKSYKEEIYKPSSISNNPLTIGQSFIEFEAMDMNGEKHRLDSTITYNNLVLMDFWYLGCGPCLRAMPSLSKLYKTYKDNNFMIYGLNPFDNLNEKLQTIKAFATKSNVQYPLIFIDKITLNKYQVNTFPTIYLIKNGKIIYSKTGFSEEALAELEKVIKENLPK